MVFKDEICKGLKFVRIWWITNLLKNILLWELIITYISIMQIINKTCDSKLSLNFYKFSTLENFTNDRFLSKETFFYLKKLPLATLKIIKCKHSKHDC